MRNSGVGKGKEISALLVTQRELDEKADKVLEKEEILKLKQSLGKLNEFVERLGVLRDTILVDCVTNLYTSADVECLSAEKVIRDAQLRVDKMIKNRKLKKNWSAPDILILVWVLAKYIELMGINATDDLMPDDWAKISELIPGTTGENCLFRWLNLHKNRLSSNQWNSEQSNILNDIVNQQGTDDWKIVSQTLYRKYKNKQKVYRTAKQCRQHWACYLNPVLKKGPWQEEEDIKLVKQILKHKGLKKWSVIAKKFNGRTENALKNRYTLLIEKQIKVDKKSKGCEINQLQLLRKFLQQRGTISVEQQISCEQSPPCAKKNQEQDGKSSPSLQASSSKTMTIKEETEKPQFLKIRECSAFSFFKNLSENINAENKKPKTEPFEDILQKSSSFVASFLNQGHRK